jgi:hypothetical protein
MTNGVFAFFAITLGTISAALASLMVCIVILEHSSAVPASPLLTQIAYRSWSHDHALPELRPGLSDFRFRP